eukprot:TRINITY_DN3208_c0_g1_i2.p1 TRINITY_DN3208_c0_g1~~TRINITY_DN3208_c0_g1_i2.p1  ORF type:complete len:261 (-),score=17.20 TRINITY_DN3208_c0_g1_i2:23-805(-)
MDDTTNAVMEENIINLCQVCKCKDCKYKCPCCGTRSCSLACCNEHKKQQQCSGKRKRSEYVPMNEFSDNLVMKDYRLLQDVVDTKDRAKKCKPTNKFWKSNKHLRSLAYRKGIHLHLMPQESTKRKQNRTRWKGEKILWKVSYNFTKTNHEIINHRVHEDTVLQDQLQEMLDSTKEQLHSQIQEYANQGIDKCRLALTLYKRSEEGVVAHENKEYIEIQKNQSLKQVLEGKTIVEYPEFIVFLDGECELLNLVQQGADID